MKQDRWTLGLAAGATLASLLILFVWIPTDIEGDVVETFRRQVSIGDAMAPTVVAVALLLVSVALGISSYLRPDSGGMAPLDRKAVSFLIRMVGLSAFSALLMLYTGPTIVELLNILGQEVGTYRQLKDTAPFKFLGFAIGGVVLVAGGIMVVENKTSLSAIWIGIGAVIGLILLFDVPFDDVLLPPNADF